MGMTKSNVSIAYVLNTPDFFLSHRLPIALQAQSVGFDIHVVTAGDSNRCKEVQTICSYGFTHHTVGFSRSGVNPVRELICILTLYKLFRTLSPNIVHLVTIKPVLYGGLAAKLSKVSSVVAAVSGLGSVFSSHTFKTAILRIFVIFLYKAALSHKSLAVIFQNYDDLEVLCSSKVLERANAVIINGSGVDLNEYTCIEEPVSEPPIVVMAARLLLEKGVLEFIEAGEILKKRGIAVDMRLIGAPDYGNPNSVDEVLLRQFEESSFVKLLGFRDDVGYQYSQANIVCLPSYYGEGLPKCLVEAAACGRAVITTDHPGCRDAIVPDETGILVPVKDPVALADAIQKLIEDIDLRQSMGRNGRILAQESFAIEKIVEQHMQIYKSCVLEGTKAQKVGICNEPY